MDNRLPPKSKGDSNPPPMPQPLADDLIPFADESPWLKPTPQPFRAVIPANQKTAPIVPAQFVEYASKGMSAQQRSHTRPAVVTTLGVLSIIFGALGIIGNIIGVILIAIIFWPRSTPSLATSVSVPSLPPAPKFAPYNGDWHAANGLGREARFAIESVVNSVAAMSGDRRIMLDNLLGEWGAKLFTGNPATAEEARQGMLEVGQFPAGPDGLRTAGSHYIRTATGAALIDDARARWIPLNSQEEFLIESNLLRARNGSYLRCSAWIARELDRLRTRTAGAMSAVQASALADWLSKLPAFYTTDETLFHSPRHGRVQSDDARMVGDALEYADNWFLADGRMVAAGSVNPSTGAPVSAMPAQAASLPTLNSLTGWELEALGAAETLLSVLLLACGIGIFTRWNRAGSGHVSYVWPKFVAIVLGILLSQQLISELETSPATRANMAGADTRGYMAGAVVGELLYPVAVLFMVRSKAARDYFSAGTAAAGAGAKPAPPFAWLSERWARVLSGVIALTAAIACIAHLAGAGGRSDEGLPKWIWSVFCAAAAATCLVAALRPHQAREIR